VRVTLSMRASAISHEFNRMFAQFDCYDALRLIKECLWTGSYLCRLHLRVS
jgi:hypothetical protein